MKTNCRIGICPGYGVHGNRRKTKHGGRILLQDKVDGDVFAALVKNRYGSHLVNATVADGKPFYQFALSEKNEKMFGLYGLSYKDKQEKIDHWVKAFID